MPGGAPTATATLISPSWMGNDLASHSSAQDMEQDKEMCMCVWEASRGHQRGGGGSPGILCLLGQREGGGKEGGEF